MASFSSPLAAYIYNMMTVSPIMSMDALAAPVEESITYQKIGEMELPEEDTEDVDYSPSDAESDDSLEWATMAEDAQEYKVFLIANLPLSVLVRQFPAKDFPGIHFDNMDLRMEITQSLPKIQKTASALGKKP